MSAIGQAKARRFEQSPLRGFGQSRDPWASSRLSASPIPPVLPNLGPTPSAVIDCTNSSPLSGLWSPQSHPKHLFYGPGCVQRHLLNVLPSPKSRVFIMAGQTLATQTPLIRQLEALLGSDLHAGTFAGIKQHGQTAGVDDALVQVSADPSIDTILSVGGGSPIDSAKVISFRTNEQRGHFLTPSQSQPP